ncbi:hypothetical protein COCMIDRAFT_23352 [Bipolaris oryzae ATCC 44560]|uniref:Uncharacterized protein n=1 Tax=Bipolaris oryzae ATCC 44560 TaxID=930090 RepID=W6ZB22_COCMI|nr:uncharacterized protein COCMIDRAFT_23352 [Bipolaris oryzae ATCC 44560]EUC48987.1 hypothetical protein COCMIDRAFT_23352 [Bipolaris oryzae ATCC 44560]
MTTLSSGAYFYNWSLYRAIFNVWKRWGWTNRPWAVVVVVPQILACALSETTRPPEPWSAQRLPGQACQNMTRIAEKSPRIKSGRGCVGESAGASTPTIAICGMNDLYTRRFQKGVVNNTQIRIAGLGNENLKTD